MDVEYFLEKSFAANNEGLLYDAIMFVPHVSGWFNKRTILRTEHYSYKNPGEQINGHLGKIYHIFHFTYEHGDHGKITTDLFEAVLLDPFTYVVGLVKSGMFGGIAKKTSTSQEFVDNVLDNVADINNAYALRG